MEKRILNRNDMEHLKMGMIKHEETFKEQVNELHRLYQIQKMLMKDTPKSVSEKCRRVSEWEPHLELTLGPRSYYQKKIKAAEPAFVSESGLSFSSSCTGSSHVKGVARSTTTTTTLDEFSSQKKLWSPEMEMEMAVSNNVNQDRLNSSPWLFQALSLNIT